MTQPFHHDQSMSCVMLDTLRPELYICMKGCCSLVQSAGTFMLSSDSTFVGVPVLSKLDPTLNLISIMNNKRSVQEDDYHDQNASPHPPGLDFFFFPASMLLSGSLQPTV